MKQFLLTNEKFNSKLIVDCQPDDIVKITYDDGESKLFNDVNNQIHTVRLEVTRDEKVVEYEVILNQNYDASFNVYIEKRTDERINDVSVGVIV